jgi:hypothetical protein
MLTVVEVRGVAQPLGDHRHRYAGGEHGGGHEVPKVVQPERGQAGVAAVGNEPLGHPVGPPRVTPSVAAEHEPVDHAIGPGGAVPLADQQLDAGRIERDAVGVPVLGRPEHRSAGAVNQSPAEPDGGVVEVDIGPAQSEELAAAGAGHHGQMQIGEEVDVLGSDDLEETADLLQ